MNLYRESILLELREYSPIEYNLFKNADIAYPAENEIMLTIEDTVLGKEKAEELIRIIEKIYNERCGFAVEVTASYKEKKSGKHREEDEQKFAMQIAEISARALHGTTPHEMDMPEENRQAEQMSAEGMAKAAGMTKAADGGALGGNRVFEKNAPMRSKTVERDTRRPLKRSDNPDVLFGRDFEEEAMPMEEIIGEIGDVVIRGKILNMDKRDIKNERTILIYDITDFTDTMTIKLFVATEQVDEITAEMKPGAFVKIKGTTVLDKFDHELTVGSVFGVKKIPDFTTSRMDNSVRKE